MSRSNRDYKREYELFHGKPKEKKRRAGRNAARSKLKKEGVNVSGKDVDHKDRNPSNNSRSNLKVKTASSNRSYSRVGEKGHGPHKKRKS